MPRQFCASLGASVQSDQPPIKTNLDIEILVRLPAHMPLINWAVALDRLTDALGGGEWCYRIPPHQPGRYEVEVQS